MTMKFYMTPGSCSTGIHILLEEIDKPFEAGLVNLLAGDQDRPEYRTLNPKGTIPMLVRDDGSAITEFTAIAWWLAKNFPKKALLPADPEGEMRVLELMNFVVAHIHGQGFARVFTSDKFAPSPDDHPAVQEQGRQLASAGFEVVAPHLPDGNYFTGQFSIADAALFYVEFWADRSGLTLPPNCAAHLKRLLARPAVQRVLREEGYRV